jgi:hypothetical protein
MSDLIPTWLFAVIGSPLQELINTKVPERFRPLSLWGVAAAVLLVAIVLTPLGSGAFVAQLPLVYAALTSGWAMSRMVARPMSLDAGVRRAVPIMLALLGFALTATALAQDSLLASPQSDHALPSASPVATVVAFAWTQFAAFIGSVLVRWLSPARKK